MTLKEYALLVKKNLKLSDVKVYGNLEQTVKTAAVCTGSGKSMIQDVLAAGADVYVTGDMTTALRNSTYMAQDRKMLTQVITVRNIFLWKI